MNDKIINLHNFSKKRHSESVDVPVYSHRLSAGPPVYITDDSIEKTIKINPAGILDPKHVAIFTVSGDSMEPLLKSGQKILVDTLKQNVSSSEELNGKVVVVRIDGGCTVKRLKITKKETFLVPDNVNHKLIKVSRDDEDFKIIGIMIKPLPPGS